MMHFSTRRKRIRSIKTAPGRIFIQSFIKLVNLQLKDLSDWISSIQNTYKGCTANIWKGLDKKAWAEFSDPEYFGKSYKGLQKKGLLKESMLISYKYEIDDRTFFNTNKLRLT